MKINILVCSASSKFPLIEALKDIALSFKEEITITVADSNKNAPTMHFYPDKWLMPFTKNENYDNIVKHLVKLKITHVLPTRDSELLFWARKKKDLAKIGITVLVSGVDSIEDCLDKLKFYRLGLRKRLPFIKTVLDLKKLNSNYKSFVVKERIGSGSKNVFLDLNYKEALKVSKRLNFPIFQPYITGKEISVDAYLDKNKSVIGLSLRHRVIVQNGESCLTKTFRNLPVEKELVKILEALNLSGCVVLQAILDQKQNLHVIECNPRFGGASTASINIGLNSLKWLIEENTPRKHRKPNFVRTTFEISQHRISTDIIRKI